MQPAAGPSGENAKGRSRERALEPLPPLVSAALEPGRPTLAARLERIAAHGNGRARYTILGEIGQGGMGKILRAWDEGLAREVAMKVVPREPSPDSSEEVRADHERRLARFVDEARITGQLDHPGIVPVYEIGIDAQGAVFFTMPLVRGQNLKKVFELVHARADGWTLQRAVDVMHTVCLTVAFAHTKGVVHRDLKPENIMVGPFGEAYVMDWGLALLLGRATREGIVGTPAYMSPEQAAAREVDPRSDVYSLGAILYELFARRMPHELSLMTRIGEGPLAGVIATPPRPLSELSPDVPPELAAICAKAMAHDPAQRYASALEMADDLEAWLAGRVVSALDSGRWTRIVKWRARNRGLALALDALVVLVLCGAAAFLWQQRTWVREVRAKSDALRVSAYAAGMSAADLGLRAHEAAESKRRLEACDPALRGWEWRHLQLRADASTRVLGGHAREVRALSVSPDGASVASASGDGTVILWDADSGTPRARLVGHVGTVNAVAFAPDGRLVASGGQDKLVLLWNASDGAFVRALEACEGIVLSLAFAADGARVAVGDDQGALALSEVASGRRLALVLPPKKDALMALEFAPVTEQLVGGYLSGLVRFFDPASLVCTRSVRVSKQGIADLDVDPQGCSLAVASESTVLVFDAATLEPVLALPGHGSNVRALDFAPDGESLATCGFDNVLRVWELGSGRARSELDGHDGDVNTVAFFPDGRRLATGAEDDSVRLWDLAREPIAVLEEHASWVDALAFSPDGRRLATGAHDRNVRVLDARDGTVLALARTEGIVDCIAWSARGELAFGCGEPAPHLAPADDPATWTALPAGEGYPKALLFDAAGERLFVRDSKGLVRAIDVRAGSVLLGVHSGDESSSLALTPDGERFATGTMAGAIEVWSASDGRPIACWSAGDSGIIALCFAPDGRSLAAGLKNRCIALFALPSGALLGTLDGHENFVSCLSFAPDGARLVSGSYDYTLRVWNPSRGESLLTLRGHTQPVTAVAFDPAGETVASASKDGSVRLWRTARSFGE